MRHYYKGLVAIAGILFALVTASCDPPVYEIEIWTCKDDPTCNPHRIPPVDPYDPSVYPQKLYPTLDGSDPDWQHPSNQYLFLHTVGTYNYWWYMFGRESWDDGLHEDPSEHRMKAIGRIHFETDSGIELCTAGWNWEFCNLGFSQYSVCADTVAHEVTHGVQQAHGVQQLTDSPTAAYYRGLNEGISDVFGEWTQAWRSPSDEAEWITGTNDFEYEPHCNCPMDLEDEGRKRNYADMYSPADEYKVPCVSDHGPLYSRPYHWRDYFEKCTWDSTYFNLTIPAYAGYLSSKTTPTSTNGVDFTGIGPELTSFFWYFAITDHMTAPVSYTEFKDAIRNAACPGTTGSLCFADAVIPPIDAAGIWSMSYNLDVGASRNERIEVVDASEIISGAPLHAFWYDESSGMIMHNARPCTMLGDCDWASPGDINPGGGDPVTTIFGRTLYIFYPDPDRVVKFRELSRTGILGPEQILGEGYLSGSNIDVTSTEEWIYIVFNEPSANPNDYTQIIRMKRSIYGPGYEVEDLTPIPFTDCDGVLTEACPKSFGPPKCVAVETRDLSGFEYTHVYIAFSPILEGVAYVYFDEDSGTLMNLDGWHRVNVDQEPGESIVDYDLAFFKGVLQFSGYYLHDEDDGSGEGLYQTSCTGQVFGRFDCNSHFGDWSRVVKQDFINSQKLSYFSAESGDKLFLTSVVDGSSPTHQFNYKRSD